LSVVGHATELPACEHVPRPGPAIERVLEVAWSTVEGSTGLVRDRLIGEPSFTDDGALNVAVGLTLATVRLAGALGVETVLIVRDRKR
jgi:hypothetical protein